MEVLVKVLGAKKVDFKTNDDKQVQGTKVYYTSINPSDDKVIGYNILSGWFEGFDMFNQFKGKQVPGDYKLIHSVKLQGSKAVVQIDDFQSIEKE